MLAEVYGEAIVSPFKAVWLVQFKDRSQPLEERLYAFYRNYYRGGADPQMAAAFSLRVARRGAMAPDYTQAIIMEMLETIVAEAAREQRVTVPRSRESPRNRLGSARRRLRISQSAGISIGLSQSVDEEGSLALHVRSFIAGFAGRSRRRGRGGNEAAARGARRDAFSA